MHKNKVFQTFHTNVTVIIYLRVRVAHHHVDILVVVYEAIHVRLQLRHQVRGLVQCELLHSIGAQGSGQRLRLHVALGSRPLEHFECLLHLLRRVRGIHLPAHHSHKLLEINRAVAILINL